MMSGSFAGRLSGLAHREVTASRFACRVVGMTCFVLLTSLGAYVRIRLPFTPVPVTLQTLFVLSSGALLGARLGAISQLAYIFIGILGVPVFAGGQAGWSWLAGATGGYILSFPIVSFLVGQFWQTDGVKLTCKLAGMLIGWGVIYLLGSIWLAAGSLLGFRTLMLQAVIPFLPLDFLKVAAALGISQRLLAPARRVFRV